MADDTKSETPVSANPLKLDWPSDHVGMTQRLQREGCRAIGRMGGDDNNLKTVIAVLKVLAKHAKVRLADQKQALAAKLVDAAIARERVAMFEKEAEKRKENALVTQIDSLGQRLKAIRSK